MYRPYKPPEPVKPKREDYQLSGALSGPIIYSMTEILNEGLDDLGDDEFEDKVGVSRQEIETQPKCVSLQDILDKLPPDTNPSDIKITTSYPRHIDYINVNFQVIKQDPESEEKAFQESMKYYDLRYSEYLEQLKQYEHKLQEYKQFQIKQLEDQLSKLKQ